MKKKSTYIFFLQFLGVMVLSVFSISQTAFALTPVQLRTEYNAKPLGSKPIKILIVPGHDDDYWGTEFGDVREGDVTVSIGQYLYNYLKSDPRFDVQITRTQMGYTNTFVDYFKNNKQAIQDFIITSRTAHNAKLSSGEIQPTQSVPHNTAQPEVALRLYGINKWANEHDIDITLHIHINDQGGRVYGQEGTYTGFAVYIPENQFSNAGASSVIGESIYKELLANNHISTYPAESRGLIEDQDLIAIGASDTVKNAAALIEYGYIYEPQFKDIEARDTVTKNLAYQTFLGVHRFFGDRDTYAETTVTPKPVTTSNTVSNSSVKPSTTKSLLPYTWSKELKLNASGADVSALQTALTKNDVYSCGVTGTYGPCTEKTVRAFQKKYKLEQTGTLGPKTRAKLNQLYSK